MIRSLSELIGDFCDGINGENITISDLVEAFHERGIALLLLVLAAPMALPFPVPPGINVMLATPLIILTFQQMCGVHKIWLPEKMKSKKMAAGPLKKMLRGLIVWLEKIEVISKPRLGILTQNPVSRLAGFLGLIMALTVCIPVPLTNTVPSLGISLMAFGTSMRDGALVIAGAVIGTGWVIMLAVAVVMFGPDAIHVVSHAFKGLF